ncbi:MAG: hypothetical protein OXI51_03485 [Chloroflexota bacterium]|nr:hypothetical protein [Chloroflexota bacterium]MDE2668701.1 hypothetical protein [Chloroflexota bacterium]
MTAPRSYVVTMDDRRVLTVTADNARTTDFHIEFYRSGSESEIFIAMFSLSDVDSVIDLDSVRSHSREGDGPEQVD